MKLKLKTFIKSSMLRRLGEKGRFSVTVRAVPGMRKEWIDLEGKENKNPQVLVLGIISRFVDRHSYCL